MWRDIGRSQLNSSDNTLRGPDSRVITTLGRFTGTFQLGQYRARSEVYVVKSLTKSLLGQPIIRDLELIKRIACVDSSNELSPKEEFPSLFYGLGKMEGEYEIQLKDDAEPFSLSTPRRGAIPLLNSVHQELERMERLGVIAKVEQPTEWCSGMVVVP